MIDLLNSNITNILPEALSGRPEVKALGYAISNALKRLLGYCQNISVHSTIDNASEQLLDMLAVELNTQYYDTAADIETKRSLVKNTLIWYMTTGTPAAVEDLVRAVYGVGEVQEWFEYNGEPYHFRIVTQNTAATDDMIQEVTRVVQNIQNARSYLEAVIIEIMQSMNLYIGCKAIIIDDVSLKTIDMN